MNVNPEGLTRLTANPFAEPGGTSHPENQPLFPAAGAAGLGTVLFGNLEAR